MKNRVSRFSEPEIHEFHFGHVEVQVVVRLSNEMPRRMFYVRLMFRKDV